MQFIPRKNNIVFRPAVEKSDEIENLIKDAGFDVMGYDTKWQRYRLRLTKEDIQRGGEYLKRLMKSAYEERAT